MLELSTELAAAQNQMERTPLIRMLATQPIDSMPFSGNYFNSLTNSEKHTDCITASDGRIIACYIRNGNDIVISRTNLEKTVWSEVIHYDSGTFYGLSVVEVSPDIIGCAYIRYDDLKVEMIDSTTGVGVSNAVLIEDFNLPEAITSVAIEKRLDGSYILAYTIFTDIENDTFEIRTRTSSDFITWSSASVVSLSPLLNTRLTSNVHLLQHSAGELLLSFDYANITNSDSNTISNIYVMSSWDAGATWGEPSKVTNYTKWGTDCVNPQLAEKSDGSLALAYTDSQSVLKMNLSTPGWDSSGCHGYANAGAIHFDSERRMLCVIGTWNYLGTKATCHVLFINIDNWEVNNLYTSSTSPRYHEYFTYNHCVGFSALRCAGEFAVVAGGLQLAIIDDLNETVTHYAFAASTDYEIEQNVDADWGKKVTPNGKIVSVNVDAETRRVYVVITNTYLYTEMLNIGYFEIDAPIDSATGKYKFHKVYLSFREYGYYQLGGQILVEPSANLLIYEARSYVTYYRPGCLVIKELSTGATLKEYWHSTVPQFPISGTSHGVYYDGWYYSSFEYTTIENLETNRGMFGLNINTGTIKYFEPTWKTANRYGLGQKCATGDGRILCAVSGTPGGVGEFNISNESWILHSGETIEGFNSDGSLSATVADVAYDPLTKSIMCGSVYNTSGAGDIGVRMFNEEGSYHKGMYHEGLYSGGWVFSEAEELTKGNSATHQSITIDEDNILWSAWIRRDNSEYSARWDRDVKEKFLDDFLVTGVPVSCTWGLTSTATLSFSVSQGHLFDPNNITSTWNDFIKKGKEIELYFGERYQGNDYWQLQGKFIVDTIQLEYSRGDYPTMAVTCVSADRLWGDMNISATESYSADSPEDVAYDLIHTHAGMDESDIIIPNFPNAHELQHQWLDEDLGSIITDLLDHFQCVPYFDYMGRFAPKVVTVYGNVAHTYTGNELIKFTPDDNYSSYVNSITVTGESSDYVEVVYEEELIESIAGTCGWWETGNRIIDVNYSSTDDQVCYDPRLVVITSIEEFEILMIESGGTEYLSYVDPENKYCQITVELPGLMALLIALLAVVIATAYLASTCTVNCGPYIFAITVVQVAASWVVSQVASYEYEVYAKPVGEELQSVSATVDDTEFQGELGGIVISEEIDDPFCYTTQSCMNTAEYEMSITKAQRSRVHFSKLAHMQDELLDKIRINHPYSNYPIDVVITELTRSYVRSEKGDGGGGSFTDTITGWKV